MDLLAFLEKGDQQFLPNLSIDHVIIGYEQQKLKCLVLKLGEKWVLPGGYISRQESVEEASHRILKERTNLQDPHIQFLAVFGAKDRKFNHQWPDVSQLYGIDWKKDYWVNDRFVTLAYYSLVNIQNIQPEVGFGFEQIEWFDFADLPPMWLDHLDIAMAARNKLKEEIQFHPVSTHLLPEKFTMPELYQLHQVILERHLDRSRFQKRMLASGLFERLPKRHQDTPGRNPFLYRRKA